MKNVLYMSYKNKKFRFVRVRLLHNIILKRSSHTYKKTSNLYPIHTQQHRNTRETKLVLDLCWHETTKIFFTTHIQAHRCISICMGNKSQTRRGDSYELNPLGLPELYRGWSSKKISEPRIKFFT